MPALRPVDGPLDTAFGTVTGVLAVAPVLTNVAVVNGGTGTGVLLKELVPQALADSLLHQLDEERREVAFRYGVRDLPSAAGWLRRAYGGQPADEVEDDGDLAAALRDLEVFDELRIGTGGGPRVIDDVPHSLVPLASAGRGRGADPCDRHHGRARLQLRRHRLRPGGPFPADPGARRPRPGRAPAGDRRTACGPPAHRRVAEVVMYEDLESIAEARRCAERAHEAFLRFREFPPEQVDRIVRAMAQAAEREAGRLAELARAETGYGDVEDKRLKNLYNARVVGEWLANVTTLGVLWRDDATKVVAIGEPMGVVAGLIPVTHPTALVIFKVLSAVKAGNAIVCAPHPGEPAPPSRPRR